MTIEKRTSFLGFERREQLPPDKDRAILTIKQKRKITTEIRKYVVLSDDAIGKSIEFRIEPLTPLFWFAPVLGNSDKKSKIVTDEQINDARIHKKSFFGLKTQRINWKP